MSVPLGFSFSPSSGDRIPMGGSGGSRASGPQTASNPSSVEIKSLKLPQRQVPGQIAPSALLNAPGAAGAGVGLAQLLPLLMQAFAPQGQQAGVPSLSPLPDRTTAAGDGLRQPSPVGDFLNRERGLTPSPLVGGAASPLMPTPMAPSAPMPMPTSMPTSMPMPAPSAPSPGSFMPRIGIGGGGGGDGSNGSNRDEWGPIGGGSGALPGGYLPPGWTGTPESPIPPPAQPPRDVQDVPVAPIVNDTPPNRVRSLFDDGGVDEVIRALYGFKAGRFG